MKKKRVGKGKKSSGRMFAIIHDASLSGNGLMPFVEGRIYESAEEAEANRNPCAGFVGIYELIPVKTERRRDIK